MGLFEKLISIVYPPKCIFCQTLLENSTILHICSECYDKLPFVKETLLSTSQDGGKSNCDGVISVFQYTGMVKDSLIRFKFYSKPSYYRTYARLMAYRLIKMIDIKKYNMILSVPLHRNKEFSRGYNQAFLISRALCRELKLPECSGLLKRLKYTETQSLLDKQSRQENIKGAFKVTAPENIKEKTILLVDDILTTGSTLEECCSMLKQAGAFKITAVVVATGRKY